MSGAAGSGAGGSRLGAVLAGALVLAAGCGDGPSPGEGGTTAAPASSSAGAVSSPVAPSTARMAERLRAVAAEIDPARDRYASSARVAILEGAPPPADPVAMVQRLGVLGEELLNAGRVEDAIATFEDVERWLRENGMQPPESWYHTLSEQRAVARLRPWLEGACVDGRGAARCSLPLEPGGSEAARADVREAIEQYRTILQLWPDDLRSRWLLNLAHTMLGTEPDARWRVPIRDVPPAAPFETFRDVAPTLGLNRLSRAGSVVMEDFDRDEDLDLLVSSRGPLDQLRYYRNEGDGSFSDRTLEAGLEGIVGGVNMVQADYDNDGFTDVLVLRGGWLPPGHPNSLLRNRGDGTFADVTEAAGLLSPAPTQTGAWGDFDGDGWIDLYVGNESSAFGTHPCALYRNNGDGTFTDVAAGAGVDAVGFVKAVAWGDVDNDGRPDLYLSRLRQPNLLYRNAGPSPDGGWTFEDVTAPAGVAEPVPSFPIWFWDYDNDGWQDLLVFGYTTEVGAVANEYLGVPHGAEPPRLYRNRGDGTFEDVARTAGLDRAIYAMGANYGDLDNDGWLDLHAGTGAPEHRHLVPNRALRNDRGRRFQDVTLAGGFGHLGKGHGIAFGDVDRDGDQDVYSVIGGAFEGDLGRNALYENPGQGNRWITLRLEGVQSNRSAIGARIGVRVEAAGRDRQIHVTVGSGGSFGASSLQQEIGLGAADRIVSITIDWPGSGRRDVLERPAMDRAYHVLEGNVEPRSLDHPPIELRR